MKNENRSNKNFDEGKETDVRINQDKKDKENKGIIGIVVDEISKNIVNKTSESEYTLY